MTNSCVTISTSPTSYGGQSLLSTENCERKLPFICEVNSKLDKKMCLFSFKQVRLGFNPDADAAKECKAVMRLSESSFIYLFIIIFLEIYLF